ncbi:hypothetical protein ACSBR1_011840 [Camellia fascicularis]
MASSFFTVMSTWPQRMCACGNGHCFVKVSRSHKNPGRAYYVCPQPVTNKITYKFKTKPLEHEELMREVFTGATATGKHHWTPREKAVDVGEGESDSVDSPGLVPFTEPYRSVVNSPPNSLTVHLEEADPRIKRKKRAQKHLTLRHGTGASQKYGIEPCMQQLMAIPDFISTPLFHFACIALENTDYQKILMCMPDHENVVGWLAESSIAKCRNVNVATMEITMM